ncbi:MAG: hypothetical protein ACR2F1_15050 [Nitrososphaeraceae archaeon]
MNKQIPPFEVYSCPLGHNDMCPKKWKNRYIDHIIICYCNCHDSKEVNN